MTGLARLRYCVEPPDLFARPRVECAHVARRVALIRQSIAHAVAEDDEIPVDDGRRRVRVVTRIDRPAEPLGQIDRSVRAERRDRFAGLAIERDELRTTVHEDAQGARLT